MLGGIADNNTDKPVRATVRYFPLPNGALEPFGSAELRVVDPNGNPLSEYEVMFLQNGLDFNWRRQGESTFTAVGIHH